MLDVKAQLLFQLQLFYYEQSKYMQMFDMINRLLSCQMQSFMYGPRQIDRSGTILKFAPVL